MDHKSIKRELRAWARANLLGHCVHREELGDIYFNSDGINKLLSLHEGHNPQPLVYFKRIQEGLTVARYLGAETDRKYPDRKVHRFAWQPEPEINYVIVVKETGGEMRRFVYDHHSLLAPE